MNKNEGFFKKVGQKVTVGVALAGALVGGKMQGAENITNTPDSSPKIAEKFTKSVEQISGSASWAVNIVEKAKTLAKEVKSKEDAMEFVNNAFGAFAKRYQNPDNTKGDLTRKVDGNRKLTEWDREGSMADFHAISTQAEELSKIFTETTKGQGINSINIKNEVEFLKGVVVSCNNKINSSKGETQRNKFNFE